MDMLARDFVLLCTLRFRFKKIPPSSYERFTDLDEMRRNLKPLEYPMGNVWKNMCRYLKVQIPRQGQTGQTSGTHPTHP
jgi:hypothetical protein